MPGWSGTGCRDAAPVDRVGIRLVSRGSAGTARRAGARYELAWATAWQDNANLLLAPALRLPALPVVRFTDPAGDEVGLRHAGRT